MQPAKLKAMRTRAGITQKQAAEIAMCALSTYQKWEAFGKGHRNPPAAKIALLKIWINK